MTTAPCVMQYEALGYLAGGFAFFGLLGVLAAYNDKASKKPWVSTAAVVSCVHLPCMQLAMAACETCSLVASRCPSSTPTTA